MINSPIQKKTFQNQTIYIKRDDLLSKEFSGNKARKFAYFLENDFPSVKKIVSYGSSQSNAMYSLSVLARLKGWAFEYYVTHLSGYLKENPHGNFRHALENGMELQVKEQRPTDLQDESVLFIEEGGRDIYAQFGLKALAQEILQWQNENRITELNIFLPSGTGTTALYLKKSLIELETPYNSTVYTVPCVGDAVYLKEQFSSLEPNEVFHPIILEWSKKRHFGKLYQDSYNIWLKLQTQMNVEFDLLYDPHGWLTLMENIQIFDKPTLYIHQGGLLGNESMLRRYKRKYDENIEYTRYKL